MPKTEEKKQIEKPTKSSNEEEKKQIEKQKETSNVEEKNQIEKSTEPSNVEEKNQIEKPKDSSNAEVVEPVKQEENEKRTSLYGLEVYELLSPFEKNKEDVKQPSFRVDYIVKKDKTEYLKPSLKLSETEILSPENDIEESDVDNIHIIEARSNRINFEAIKSYIPEIKLVNKGIYSNKVGLGGAHPKNVTLAFLEGNYYGLEKKEIKIPENLIFNYYSSEDFDIFNKMKNMKGLINMSYGLVEENISMRDLSPTESYYLNPGNHIIRSPFFSNRLYDENYVKNNQLKIVSAGNYETKNTRTFWAVKSMHSTYAKLSSDLQKLARSEVLIVKNMINDDLKKKYKKYENLKFNTYTDSLNRKWYEINGENSNNPKLILLRSFSAVMPGFTTIENNSVVLGSSFSAPKVARLAYEIKKKFPFLTYQQVKQVILSSAVNDNSGYLSNITGFGIIDYEKALKGPSNFNAGLIDEQAFYLSNYDKIYDKDNTYFYVDIDKGTYEFKNDIESGLSGDGFTNDYLELGINGKLYPRDKTQLFEARIPLVLDSERRYYRNVAQAGLRKAGKGELILSGKQYYTAKSQVIDGTLTLKNDSNSSYEVFKPAILKLESDNINITGNIKSSGTVEFKANTNINEYLAEEGSVTNINLGKKIKADKFYTNGNIYFNLNKVDNIDDLKNVIEANNLDISKANLENSFLFLNIDENKILSLDFTDKNTKKLEELTKEELRNIPSYDVNKNKFFEKYIYRGINNGRLNSYINDIANFKEITNDKEKATAQIFTDIYSSNLKEIIENNEKLEDNISSLLSEDVKKDTEFNFLTSIITNIDKDEKYSIFNKNMLSYAGILKRKNLSLFADYSFMNNSYYKVNSNIKSEIFGFGVGYNLKNIILKTAFKNIKIESERNINETKINSNSNIKISEFELMHKIKYNLTEKTSLNLINSIIYSNIFYKAFDENSENKEFKYNISFEDNILNKLKLKSKIILNTEISEKISLQNELGILFNLNEDISLNAKILSKKTSLQSKPLEKIKINYGISLNYLFNKNLEIKTKFGIDNSKKLNFLLNFKYNLE